MKTISHKSQEFEDFKKQLLKIIDEDRSNKKQMFLKIKGTFSSPASSSSIDIALAGLNEYIYKAEMLINDMFCLSEEFFNIHTIDQRENSTEQIKENKEFIKKVTKEIPKLKKNER